MKTCQEYVELAEKAVKEGDRFDDTDWPRVKLAQYAKAQVYATLAQVAAMPD